jgi:hypothetical protein
MMTQPLLAGSYVTAAKDAETQEYRYCYASRTAHVSVYISGQQYCRASSSTQSFIDLTVPAAAPKQQ